MAAKFQPTIKRARINVPGFSADTMLRFGNILNNAIAARMDRAQDVYDSPAPPLADTYRARKEKKGERGTSVRDMYFTGRTRRSMKVLRVEQNRATLGFTDGETNRRAAINNRKIRQYGVSPVDRALLMDAINQSLHQASLVEAKVG